MCRRVITHYMHHDVRAPMILDSISPNPLIYANPLRTNFHTCELQLPPLESVCTLPVQKCPYHTCCIPHTYVTYCADIMEYTDEEDVEPEECEAFTLEHHHERLPYFGDACSYREEIPATWENLLPVEGNCPDWFRGFAHEARFQPKWEELCFKECEKLYTLEKDEAILHASMLDVINSSARCTRSMVQEARKNLVKIQGELREQRKLVFDLFQWALESCGSCEMDID